MTDIGLIAPIQPYQVPKDARRGLNDLVRRISAKAAVEGRGNDFLQFIYLAGLYHGAALTDPARYLALNERQSGMAVPPEPRDV